METLILFLILLPVIPAYRIQFAQVPGVEHIKTLLHMLSMTVAQTTFILSFLFNEFTPGYIYAGNGFLSYNFAYDGISLTYLIVSAVLTSLCVISICEFMAIDDNVKKNIQLLFLLEIVLFNFFFNS